MNQKFIKHILVGGLIAMSIQVYATGFNKTNITFDGKVMTANQFYDTLATTKSEQVVTKFGFPDQILTLKDKAGETKGVVWVYKSAVQKIDGIKDVSFMFIAGEMKYAILSDPS